jgi:hypothetical protein
MSPATLYVNYYYPDDNSNIFLALVHPDITTSSLVLLGVDLLFFRSIKFFFILFTTTTSTRTNLLLFFISSMHYYNRYIHPIIAPYRVILYPTHQYRLRRHRSQTTNQLARK